MIEYFYLLTIQWSAGGNPNFATMSGIWSKPRETTEQEIYGEIFAHACAQFGAPNAVSAVMFYRLVRNKK